MQNHPRTLAFYLPQFHTIPENDSWWGEGFTEWSNVKRAQPQFDGHYQPEIPSSALGYYSLDEVETLRKQVQLAGSYGIDGFVFYHYWFAGKRLLEKPLDMLVASDVPMPFAICWANENWTRRWDGKDQEVLIAQEYDDKSASDVFKSFIPYLQDSRYLRVHGKPLILVHRVDHIPKPQTFAEQWRSEALAAGLGEIYLVASETFNGIDPAKLGFDAIAEFPPVGDNDLRTVLLRKPVGLAPDFRGRVHSYSRIQRRYMRRRQSGVVRHPGVIPRWDNTPRRRGAATIYVGASPAKYSEWLTWARRTEYAARGSEGLVFVNAWNEWAEGAYLEPDELHGMSYLEASQIDPPLFRLLDRTPALTTKLNLRSIAFAAAASAKSSLSGVKAWVARLSPSGS